MSVCGQQATTQSLHSIRPTAEQYARAVRRARRAIQQWSNDGDLDRSNDDWEQDVFYGALAEVVARDELDYTIGLNARLVDDTEDASYDIRLEDNIQVEIKNRKLWDRKDPDMLIRNRTAIDADCYMLAEIDRDADGYLVNLTGWVAQPEVMAYSSDFHCGSHQKLIVDREYLRDFETVSEYLGELS